uniref:Ion-translocating oxidoreductase complex subunit D n=1 Tax=Candidatus Kentrum sp. MB TaxID=2138164 RepID=A0A450XMF6_9GAMM|nr:MAG: electron transport complex protein RnfD [Candidatus Kentron sp. MB]VFK30429.1 MAG: electron transport complex protein RnfD [Candidatus Kentron sp. MB]VFK75217.1 MAG: electron transport complex protein RnfD [Candidatus Kentron sp. MB]
MAENTLSVELRTSPHIRTATSVDQIMRNVVYSLLPVCAFAVYQFGISALALILATTLACVVTEQIFCWLSEKPTTVGDNSAVVSGILLGLTLPPGFPLWMAVVAGFIGIALGKVIFGGIGFNVFNPALVGRAFVQAAFPVAITTWTPAFAPGRFSEFIPSTWTIPFAEPVSVTEWVKQASLSIQELSPGTDAFTGATALSLQKFEQITTDVGDMFLGFSAGSAGETSALLILICGGYLVFRKMMDWRIVAAVLLGAFVTAGLFFLLDNQHYPDPFFVLFSGGLMLGAVFMATDMVASPVTPWGVWIYGILIGFVTVIIRFFGGLSEGVMYAILLGNAASPLIEAVTQPRVYGTGRKQKAKSHE